MRPAAWLKSFLPTPPTRPPLSLQVINEDALLTPVDSVAEAALPLPHPGVTERVCDAHQVTETEMRAALDGAAAGASIPEWADGAGGGLRYGVNLARVADVHYLPGFGAVIDSRGRVLGSTVREAMFLTPDLGHLPFTAVAEEAARYAPPAKLPVRAAGSVFMAWGGLTNYGHFLLDCMPGLVLLADRGLLHRFPAMAPPLESWHREMIAMALGEDAAVEEVAAPVVEVDDLLFTSCMDHFLHAPNTPLDRVRARVLQAAPAAPSPAGRRVYLTRRGVGKRILVNEDALEAALSARGFTVVSPERLPIADQVALFRDAEVVVAATGAALANALFMAEGAEVFEIQPSNYLGIWVRALCLFVGVRWRGFFTPSPLPVEGDAPAVDWMFSWALPLDDFLQHLDAHLTPT